MVGLLALFCRLSVAAPPQRINQQALAEIQALLEEKASWTPAQGKIESQLIHGSKRKRGVAFAPGAPSVKLDLQTQPDGRVLVDIHAEVSPALLTLIQQGGGQIVGSFPQFHSVRAVVTLDQLDSLAGSADVKFIRRAAKATTNTGSVTSEGDITHKANVARSAVGVNGQGVKVGVLSDSIDYLASSQATGDLGDVTILPGQSGVPGSGEGTAILEIIHDLAPGAQLYFATAFNGEASFAQNILDLRSNGCQVIIDDVYYYDEPPFQDGIIARAVNNVTASGALYFSAAGNDGNLKDGTSGTWEGDFVDGGQATGPVSLGGGRIHSFGDATFNAVVNGGNGVDLFWADPLGASTNDYDLFLLDPTGTSVIASSLNLQNGTQDPYERLDVFPGSGSQIVIVKTSGADRFLHLVTSRGRLSRSTAGATRGHSAAATAFGIAAVDASTSYPFPFSGGAANPVETFSSDGPRRIFFNPDGSPITPGNFSSTGGSVLQKPDFTAADGVSTSLYSFDPFYGTSAAAPHAGSIAALLLSYDPTLSSTQVRNALTASALDIENPGPDRNSGVGIVMAYEALQSLPAKPIIVPGPVIFVAESCPSGGVDPGEKVTVSLVLTNRGPASTTNLVATLLSSGGITLPSGPQTYGVLTASGGTASRTFTFIAGGNCGGTNVATLQLRDGNQDLGAVSFILPLGKPRLAFVENFDAVTPPVLPPGWLVSWSGAGAPWASTSGAADTLPNSAFAPDPYGTTDNALLSPMMFITTASAQLKFRHSFNTYNTAYDGGVLEISINGAAFADIIATGGSFQENGYVTTLNSGYGNPLGGRMAWSGYSGGFLTTRVSLPAAAAGQNVQLRWRFGSSSSYGGSGGWYIDTISVTDGFDCCVPVPNDIAVSVSDSPDPAVLGGSLTYTITVVNTGPSTANNVTLVDTLPPGFTLQSLTYSPPVALSGHGTSGGTITFNVGTLPGGSTAGITIGGTPGSTGFITNRVAVTRSEPDANPSNNTATAVTTVLLPSLTINDTSLLEGNSGTTNAAFTVNLSAPVAQAVTVHYATSDQTAVAGRDYLSASGTLVFAPSMMTQTVLVPVIGNTLNEPNKTFFVTLSGPTNASLARNQATGTILNDDPFPNLSINDALVGLPESGTTNAVFTVSLSTPSGQSVSVIYYTSNGTASAASDYVPLTGEQVTFLPGETNKAISVAVNNHTTSRPSQTFYVALTTPHNSKIARAIGLGTIVTSQPGQADHFVWSAISSPQVAGRPIAATITAQDYWNNRATNFVGSVGLSGWTNAENGASGMIEDFESGTWPKTPWIILSNTPGYISATAAHDGAYGLRDPEWTYRTDVQLGMAGDAFSWWIRPDSSSSGRAYLGFGASASGCWSLVAAPNTGEFIIQQNASYNYFNVASASQNWQSGKWYRVEVQFLTSSSIVCNLYDSDGTTLLKTLAYSGVTGLPGGVAIRSFDGFSLDTISEPGAASSGAVTIAPTRSGSFSNGVWQGQVTVSQPATNVTVQADDGHSHTGWSSPFDVVPVPGQVTSFAWNPISSPQTSGIPFTATIIAQDFFRTPATNFNGVVALTASGSVPVTNTILPSPSYQYSSSGAYTFGYAFTPNVNMTVTHVRHYFGTKVSIWTDAGALVVSRTVTSTPGTWRETPLVSPVQLTAGTTYRVAVYTGGGNYYYRTDMAFSFPNGTINQGYEASGDAFPAISDYYEWMFVDLKYTIPKPVPVAVNPALSANFTNGVWRGKVSMELPATAVTIAADDGSGHLGSSNPFDVAPGPGHIHHLVWSAIASPQAVGEPFAVTVTAQDYYNSTATNFTGPVALSGSWPRAVSTNTILPSPTYVYTSGGYYTYGYAFTPTTNLTVTHFRHYFGTKVSIWTDAGVLLATRAVSSVPGTWVETPLTTPIQLTAGTRYRVAAYSAGATSYYRTDMAPTFPNGTINQSYEISGDAFPGGSDSAQWWFVDLKYTVSSPSSIAITPSLSGNFSNGVWSGSLSVAQVVTNLVLQADDGNGHTGASNPFNVAPRGQVDHFAWNSIASPQSFGVPFPATLTAQDPFNSTVTSFNGAAALSASGSKTVTNTILQAPSYQYSSSATYTFGYAFTPNVNMTVTHVRHFFGTKVSIWTDAGVLVATRSVTSTPGTWRETALISPVQLTAGTTYRVGVYTGGGNYYYRTDMGFSFPNGTINQSYEASGDAFPSVSDSYYWILVDLKYTVPAPVPLAVTPANSGGFSNGVWSGSLAVTASGQPVNNVVLRADDGGGHSGFSNPFNMVPGAGQIDHLVWNPIASSEALGEPFAVTVTAQDYYNNPATNFAGPVKLSGLVHGVFRQGGSVVPYFSDNNPAATGPEAPIILAGFTPLHVTDISSLDLSGYTVLFIDETFNNAISPALLGRLGDIKGWVANGGILIVHDRSAGNLNPNPFLLGTTGIQTVRFETSDVDVIPPGTNLVVAGPFGTIGNTTLDGGNSSAHGYVPQNQLPASATAILSIGGNPSEVVDFSYGLGLGAVYYSSIPLDCYLLGGGCTGFPINAPLQQIYTPNVLAYAFALSQPISVSISPTNSGSFSNGVWQGAITVTQPATNLTLLADDGNGHTGASNPFNVAPRGQVDHFAWNSIASPQSFGVPIAATLTAQDAFNSTVTSFNGPVTLSASGSTLGTNTILPSPSYQYSSSGSYTFGYAFTPNVNMTVTHVRHFFGTKVSIWTDAGALVATRSVTSTPGTWRETALISPVQLTAGTTYRVGVYTGGGNYYYRTDMAFSFPNGTINQSYEASGDAFPSVSDSYYWMFVDLKYTVPIPVPLAVGPANSGAFSNGVWSGSLAVTGSGQPLSNVALRADDGSGHSGSSNPFNMVPAAGQVDHLAWSPIASPQMVGQPFGITVTAQDYYNGTATNFSGPVALSGSWPGALSTNTILPSPTYVYSSSGTYTFGYAFTPATNLTVTHVRSYFGTKVSIWTDGGVLLASRAVSSVPGTWVETPLTTPIQLTAGTRYRVGAYTAGGNYFWRTDMSLQFPSGTINQAYEFSGDGFPNSTDYAQWWFVDLKYTVTSPLSVPITPALSGSFINGVWSGSLSVAQSATNLVVRADDGHGHTASSNPFNVIPIPQQALIVKSPVNRVVFLGGSASLSVLASGTAPLTYQWSKEGVPIAGATTATYWILNAQTNDAARYSVVVTNLYGSTSVSNITLTVVAAGNVVAWGDNNAGQTSVPPGLAGVVAVAGGYDYSLALRNGGTVTAWGDDTTGQTDVPSSASNVVAIAAGYYHALALRSDGTLVAWGDNSDGQTTPPPGLNNVMAIAAGGFHSLALRNDGTVVCWGFNGYGQANPPAGLNNVVGIAGGSFHSLALRRDGTVVAWGYNVDGETNVPAGVSSLATAAAGGRFHNLVALRDGSVLAWGYNGSGQASVPSGLSNVVSVAGGGDFSLALRGDGTVYAWGYNGYGQTAPPPGLTNVAAIANGYDHSLALIAYSPPTLMTQPQNLTLPYGANAYFGAAYGGALPLAFQWQKNQANLAGANTATLQLPGVTRADAGTYRLTIANVFGSITSSNAALRVLVPQEIQSISKDAKAAHLWFGDALGGGLADPANIEVQATTNVLPTNTFWTVVSNGTVVVTNGVLRFDDPNPNGASRKFYRVIEK
jgi:uncharacterized repeat protein (TIGR01451 family)